MAKTIDLLVDLRILFNVGVRARQIGLGLVVVVVRDKILNSVVRKELAELITQLRGECFVVRDDKRRPLHILNHVRDSERLARSRHAVKCLVLHATLQTRNKRFDRFGLVPSRFVVRDEFEGHTP